MYTLHRHMSYICTYLEEEDDLLDRLDPLDDLLDRLDPLDDFDERGLLPPLDFPIRTNSSITSSSRK